MAFPVDAYEMRVQGYKLLDHSRCDGCFEEIEWWRTPNGHQIPMNPMSNAESPAISHWATCTMVKQFRKKAS